MLITLNKKGQDQGTIQVQTHNIVYMECEGLKGTHIVTVKGSLHVEESQEEIQELIMELQKAEFTLYAKLFKALEKSVQYFYTVYQNFKKV